MSEQTHRRCPECGDRETLRRKARYGHRSYLYWTSKDGAFHFAPYCKAGIKSALLDVGGKGRFYWFDGAGNSNIAQSLPYMIYIWRCAA